MTDSEIGHGAIATEFQGQNIVGANSLDFNATVSPNVQNAPVDPGNSTGPTESNVFFETTVTLIDADANGFPETPATRSDSSQRLAGISNLNGGRLASIALAPQSFNTAIDGTVAPESLFSFEGNATDGFGNNNGTFQGGLTASATGAPGVSNTAVEFTGNSSQFVELANPLSIGDKSHTVEFWVNLPANAPSDFMAFLSNFQASGERVYWGTDTSGHARINWSKVGSTAETLNGTTDLRDGQWHHIAFVRNTSSDFLRIYVDGVNEGSDNLGRARYDFGGQTSGRSKHRRK